MADDFRLSLLRGAVHQAGRPVRAGREAGRARCRPRRQLRGAVRRRARLEQRRGGSAGALSAPVRQRPARARRPPRPGPRRAQDRRPGRALAIEEVRRGGADPGRRRQPRRRGRRPTRWPSSSTISRAPSMRPTRRRSRRPRRWCRGSRAIPARARTSSTWCARCCPSPRTRPTTPRTPSSRSPASRSSLCSRRRSCPDRRPAATGGGAAAIGLAEAGPPPGMDLGGGAAGIADFFGGIKAAARRVLNFATYYQMKERAGKVGAGGLNPLLRDLRAAAPELRIHLVGHSFGGRLVTAAALGRAGSEDVAPASMTLLQAAFSHNGFAQDFDREPRRLLPRGRERAQGRRPDRDHPYPQRPRGRHRLSDRLAPRAPGCGRSRRRGRRLRRHRAQRRARPLHPGGGQGRTARSETASTPSPPASSTTSRPTTGSQATATSPARRSPTRCSPPRRAGEVAAGSRVSG